MAAASGGEAQEGEEEEGAEEGRHGFGLLSLAFGFFKVWVWVLSLGGLVKPRGSSG